MSKVNRNNFKYYVNADGENVMRVSDVLSILSKDHLLYWANSLGFKKISYKGELERTGKIGSLCHAVLEDMFNPHEIPEVDFDAYEVFDDVDREEAVHALQSFTRWFSKFSRNHTYNVMHTEFVVVGKNLGCTIDCIISGWKNPNKMILVDYKSSGFYLTQFLQLAANTMLYEEVYGKNTIEGVMIVAMNKKSDKKPAKARFISRKNLEPFILCFQCMYDVTVGTKMLSKQLMEITERVE